MSCCFAEAKSGRVFIALARACAARARGRTSDSAVPYARFNFPPGGSARAHVVGRSACARQGEAMRAAEEPFRRGSCATGLAGRKATTEDAARWIVHVRYIANLQRGGGREREWYSGFRIQDSVRSPKDRAYLVFVDHSKKADMFCSHPFFFHDRALTRRGRGPELGLAGKGLGRGAHGRELCRAGKETLDTLEREWGADGRRESGGEERPVEGKKAARRGRQEAKQVAAPAGAGRKEGSDGMGSMGRRICDRVGVRVHVTERCKNRLARVETHWTTRLWLARSVPCATSLLVWLYIIIIPSPPPPPPRPGLVLSSFLPPFCYGRFAFVFLLPLVFFPLVLSLSRPPRSSTRPLPRTRLDSTRLDSTSSAPELELASDPTLYQLLLPYTTNADDHESPHGADAVRLRLRERECRSERGHPRARQGVPAMQETEDGASASASLSTFVFLRLLTPSIPAPVLSFISLPCLLPAPPPPHPSPHISVHSRPTPRAPGQRCDGAKPACTQCARAHRADACAYDDGRGKTRTQALRERIARLEDEIAALRGPSSSSTSSAGAQAVFLHDPHAPTPSVESFAPFDLSEFGLADGEGRVFSGGAHRRTPHGSGGGSSAGSSLMGSPSPSAVGSARLSVCSVGGGGGASPYSSFTDSMNSPPVNSPHAGFAPARTLSPAMLAPDPYAEPEPTIPPETRRALLEVFLAHRAQAGGDGFALHPTRLRASLRLPPLHTHSPDETAQFAGTPRHPVLESAMCLWASLLARGTPLAAAHALERRLLARTQAALADALTCAQAAPHPFPSPHQPPFEFGFGFDFGGGGAMDMGAREETETETVRPATAALDAIQASVLLARYFFATARLHEASYHASAAADLAVQCGLHQLGAPSSPYDFEFGVGGSASASALRLAPPADAVELGERIGVFWEVYVLDRLLAVALRRPPCIADDDCVETRVDTPWPEDVEEYESIPVEAVRGGATLRTFFAHQGQQPRGGAPGGFSRLALRAKAAALYAAAARAAANSPPSLSPSSTPAPAPALELALARLAGALLPAHQLGAALPGADRRAQVQLHTIVHAASVQLHLRGARAGEPGAVERCVRAARGAAMAVRFLGEEDYGYLDPVVGPCWTAIAAVFSLEPVQAGAATPGSPCAAWAPADLGALLAAVTRLGARFPIMAFQLALA
ncbi:hypothetical protein DFH11DRAFT_1542643 [Phellopilus nigrolimitatus]|nr:hypothetical protein DFH11DRAFT_1542643 [Phellopilus nigrolimitatus]